MPENNNTKSKRIAKNTLLLYVRMLFLMAIGLFTSRVILQTLGVEDFGTYNVVGGFVAMFAVISGSLSAAASRFLNYEMGKGNESSLSKVFSSIVVIHILLALIIAILTESIGIWFVNNKMVIAPERLDAANWVFQFSVLTFCLNLVTVPYHAAIIAHEKMSTFAYISIFDGIAKLLVCYLLLISPIDRLVFYAFLQFLVHFISRGLFYVYCKRKFNECRRVHFILDRSILKEIFGFASWNFIGASSAVLRNQGGNVLINLFFGTTVNAARGVANQVLHAVQGFVTNFMTALNPQITQSYARGDNKYMMTLIYYGSKLSFYMLLFLGLPIIMNTDYLLHLWLTVVPEHSVTFVQLILVFTMLESLSHTLVTAQLATGKIRDYQLIVGGLQLMNLPVSYVVLKLGGPPETIFYVAIFFSVVCLATRLIMLRKMINLNAIEYISKVVLNVFSVSVISSVIPFVMKRFMGESLESFILVSLACLLCTALSVIFVGFNAQERVMAYEKIRQVISKKNDKHKRS